MRVLRALAPVALVAVVLSGCTTEEVVQTGCEEHGTALIMFMNSTPDSTFNALVDSTAVGTVAPGETLSRDVSAGQHTLRCCLPISGDACTSRTDTFPACSQTSFDCVLPPCMTQNTATVSLFNDSSCCPLEVYVDGVKVADLDARTSKDVSLSADAVHSVEFLWLGATLCAKTVSLPPCNAYSMHCSRP